MPSTVSSTGRQREANSGDLPLIGATPRGQQPVNDVDDAWFPLLVGRCAQRYLAHKEICSALGDLDKGQVSRQFQGDGHLSAKRIGALPSDVWLDIAEGIRAHFGVGDPRAEQRAAVEDAMRAIGRLAAFAVGEQ